MRLHELSGIHDSNVRLSNFSHHQLQLDSLTNSFAQQVTDWRQLLAMSGASLTFQGVQALSTAASAGRFLSASFALAAEAASFGVLHRSLRGELPLEHFFEGWRKDVLQFGILKGVGRILGSQNYLLRHSAQSFGMLLGSEAASALDWMPEEAGSFSQRMLHGMALSIALESSGYLGNLFTGGRFHTLQNTLQMRHSRQIENRSLAPVNTACFSSNGPPHSQSLRVASAFIQNQRQLFACLHLPSELKLRVSRVMEARFNRLHAAMKNQDQGHALTPIEHLQIEDLEWVNERRPMKDALFVELQRSHVDVQVLERVLRREEIRERVRSEFDELYRSSTRRNHAMLQSAEGVASQMLEGALPASSLPESRFSTLKLALRFVFEIVRLRWNGYHKPSRAGRGMLSALEWRSVESAESLRTVEEAHILAETDSSRPRGLFVLSNHTSFLDFMKFLAEDSLARFGAGDFLFGIPIFRDVLRIAGHFRITRQKGNQNDRSVSERAIAELGHGIDRVFSAGNHVYLFPEGFLSAEGGLGVFKKGPSHEAFRRGNYVLLRVVNGLGQIWRNFEFQRDPNAHVSYRLPLRRPIVSDSRLMDPREYESADHFHAALCRNMLELYMNTLDQLRDLHRQGDAAAADQIRVLYESHREGIRLLREGRVDEAKAWCDMPEYRQKVNYEFLQAFSTWLQRNYPRLLEERL